MKFKLFCLSILFLISAGTICSADKTHMGVEPANLITLQWQCEENQTCGFRRSLPSGQVVDFDIPDRMVFVVTEFDWRFKFGPFPIVGPDSDVLSFHLSRGLLEFNSPVTSYGSTKNVSCGEDLYCAVASGTEQMTTGFVANELLRPAVRNTATDELLSNDSEFLRVRVRGYFVAPSCGFFDLPPCNGRR